MATRFILQGFTTKTHQAAVRRVLACPGAERAILSVAFINKSGVDLIGAEIKSTPNVVVFAGIRNDLTSRQGLEALLALGATVYVVDTGGRSPIYHPKLYYVRGPAESRLIIGSANLTLGGLNNNIEASVAMDLDRTVAGERDLGVAIEAEFDAVVSNYTKNVFAVTSSILADLQSKGLLLDENAARAPRPVTMAASPSQDAVPRIVLKVPGIFLPAQKATPAVKPKPAGIVATAQPSVDAIAWEAVWQSKALTERDLNIPTARGTNRTGSINLDKGLLGSDVDHRHYFRDDVFNALTWTSASSTVDEAFASFQLVVKGVDYGTFHLRVAHTTSTTTASYRQRNAMTRLSWGLMVGYIAHPTLLGRTFTLYRDTADPTRFLVEID
jgi:HKD family nuclease